MREVSQRGREGKKEEINTIKPKAFDSVLEGWFKFTVWVKNTNTKLLGRIAVCNDRLLTRPS